MSIKDGQTRRGPRGRGTIFWSKSRQCYIGRVTVNGRRVERSAPTQAEVVARLADAEPPGPSVTFADWAERYIATHHARPSTLHLYRTTLGHVAPLFGATRLADLTPFRIESATASLTAAGLHPNTVRKHLGRVGAILAAAVRDCIIAANPARAARKAKGIPTPIDPFVPAELAAIIAAASARRATRIIAVMAATGCRFGEACAFDAGDWNPAAGTLSISKTHSSRFGMGPPKSSHSVRTIRVPAEALPALAAPPIAGPLFPTATGRRTSQQVVGESWRLLLARLGLRYRNPHQMRHSVATAMISHGVPIGDAAKYLGDTAATVVKTYLHTAGADPAAAMSRILAAKPSDEGSQDGREVGNVSKSVPKRCKSRRAA